MGVKGTNPVMARDVGLVLTPVAFTINGTSNPLLANNAGDELIGQQVTRSAQGTFTFQINSTYAKCIGAIPGGIFGASGDIYPQVTACDPVGGGANSITVKTLTGAVATDPANGSTVTVLLVLKTNTRRAST